MDSIGKTANALHSAAMSLSSEQTVLSGAGSWVLGSESSGRAGDVIYTRLTEEIWGRKISQFTPSIFWASQ